MEITVTLKLKIDEESIAEKYPNYETTFNSVDEFTEAIMDSFETPIMLDNEPVNFLEKFGYEVMIMDRSDKEVDG